MNFPMGPIATNSYVCWLSEIKCAKRIEFI